MTGNLHGPAERLREDALACIHAAIAAVEPGRLVRDWLEDHGEALEGARSVYLAAVGKAAAGMVLGAVGVLGDRLSGGVVIVPRQRGLEDFGNGDLQLDLEGSGQRGARDFGLPRFLDRLRGFRGGHPVPTDEGVAGARAILELATGLEEDDLLLTLVSGGGSALMTLPPKGIPLEAVQETTDALLRAGADIHQLNTVRKHLDRIKGGRLAAAAHPARTLSLVLSDVVGDPLDTIASGPVSPDPTTYDDALDVLEQLGLTDAIPDAVREHLEGGRAGTIDESPKPGDPVFKRVEAHVVGNNRLAADAARAEAERRGYRTLLLSTRITGEAREVGRVLAGIGAEILSSGTPLSLPACLIAGGETTVTVTGTGKGGRNQEVVLGAALALDQLLGADDRAEAGPENRLLLAAAGTDGVDGPTDAAGALATGTTVRRAQQAGLDARRALAHNDAYPFFSALGDLIETGPTGTNVMDLLLAMAR